MTGFTAIPIPVDIVGCTCAANHLLSLTNHARNGLKSPAIYRLLQLPPALAAGALLPDALLLPLADASSDKYN